MSSFVGDLWKKVGELKLNVSTNRNISSFPYVYDEKMGPVGRIGPFLIFNGQDFDVSNSERKEESIFRRVSVFVCKEKDQTRLDQSKRIVKALKTIRHPRILKYISSKESEGEVVLVTEWVEPFKKSHRNNNKEMEIWGAWSIKEVVEFLRRVGREICVDGDSGNLWMTASGEVKVALFNESEPVDSFSNGDNFKNYDFDNCHLVQLSKTFDHLVTLSTGERISLIKKLLSSFKNSPSTNNYFKRVLKFLILPELVRTRKFTPIVSGGGAETPISIEEVQFLFVHGKELILFNENEDEGVTEKTNFNSSNDFMFLLSDLFVELLSKHPNNPIPLTICLLDQIASGSPDTDSNSGISLLFTEKYAQDKIYPQVSVLLGHPFAGIRESALKALQGLCGRLGAKVIGNDVLRQLAKLQGDVEGVLRFKALEVLAKTVWPKLSDDLKSKICGPAVSRALSDSFPPCRRSGLDLLRQGIGLMEGKEIAMKLIPAVGMLLVEDDEMIRREAFECFEGLILPTLRKRKERAKDSAPLISKDSAPLISKDSASISIDHRTVNNIDPIVSCNVTTSAKSFNSPVLVDNLMPTTLTTAPKTSGNKMKLGSIKKII